ncbi:type I restriction-modification system subunit M [Fructobacillus americanaquae]|uniref:site-specific DNA-methyltransferase (adenine-specific) n=1 Tax=Fructobacillus americanaquae TaxID=2940302 RepID=A0ABY5C4Q6_9LACO|nr:type I restriction-modification system subunit M [Fructobacillus americanaquae]USS92553.1 type I restriction-modification system subunit M [Fructobacillus americanaquae]
MALTADRQALIWKTLNETRGKIEPSEYKNYIFGIMFYKFLSEKAQLWLDGVLQGEKWANIWAQDPEKAKSFMQGTLGYVIEPGDMFSDWKEAINTDKFNIMMVKDALTRFDNGVSPEAKSDYAGIFSDIDLGSSRLGANAQTRAATMMDWINLMDEIELDTDADVLGDLYEYLIGMFAANSGAKAGEFYTPHQVSDIMARILTAGRENQETYTLYDPTMGSGSLLITTASYMKNAGVQGAIKYYGQELITTTYNLARMNLMMHGVEYNDINLRNSDTLAGDWPDGTIDGVDSPRMFDAVMANPPYSQKWDAENREDDPRFKFGVAPKGKADYAFLLHGLYHLNNNGRMAIVLPHGILFRGAAEGRIRKALLENRNISAVIGLPANIFTNTSIPTIIMVLEKNRATDDVLFIDASKGFEKQKNSNKLRQEDIEKIVDTYLKREDVEKYAHVATMDEIRENDFNLNIPRYVDTFEEEEPIDLVKVNQDIVSVEADIKKEEAELLELVNQLAVNDDSKAVIDSLKSLLAGGNHE